MQRILILLILGLSPTLALTALDKPLMPGAKVAFLGFIDTSTEGAYNGLRIDETARMNLLEGAMRDRFVDDGFIILSNDLAATEFAGALNPAHCYGCDVHMARRLGAEFALVGDAVHGIRYILKDFFKS